MKTTLHLFAIVALSAFILHTSPFIPCASAQGTAFTYQGFLTDNGAPANGAYDLEFQVFDAATSGTQQGSTVNVNDQGITNGLFIVTIDPGAGVFTSAARWLDIAVRPGASSGAYTNLVPRQPVTSTPYAIYAGKAMMLDGTVASNQLTGTYSSALTFNNAGNSFTGNGSALTSLNASQFSSGTVPDARLSANVALLSNAVTFASNVTSLGRLSAVQLNVGSNHTLNAFTNRTSIAGGQGNSIAGFAQLGFIGGGRGNSIGTMNVGAFIGGGLSNRMVAGGGNTYSNTVIVGGTGNNMISSDEAFIGAGQNNSIGAVSFRSVIAGGFSNSIAGFSSDSVIGGGNQNSIGQESIQAVIAGGAGNIIELYCNQASIGGGFVNRIAQNGYDAVIAGGLGNLIDTNSSYSFIGSGYYHVVGPNCANSFIGGGIGNQVLASNSANAIVGGRSNIVQGNASFGSAIGGGSHNTNAGDFATIPGGSDNFATNRAFAAGNRANARHSGSFVWADASSGSALFSTNANSFTVRATGGARFVSAVTGTNPTAGVVLTSGSGTWASLSDRNAKENLVPVDSLLVLERLTAIPLATWNYKTQDKSVRHIGPMAQDFAAAFGVGEDDKTITTVDADGVALAAIQGLNEKVEQRSQDSGFRIQKLEAENAGLKQRLDMMEKLVNRLSKAERGDGQ